MDDHSIKLLRDLMDSPLFGQNAEFTTTVSMFSRSLRYGADEAVNQPQPTQKVFFDDATIKAVYARLAQHPNARTLNRVYEVLLKAASHVLDIEEARNMNEASMEGLAPEVEFSLKAAKITASWDEALMRAIAKLYPSMDASTKSFLQPIAAMLHGIESTIKNPVAADIVNALRTLGHTQARAVEFVKLLMKEKPELFIQDVFENPSKREEAASQGVNIILRQYASRGSLLTKMSANGTDILQQVLSWIQQLHQISSEVSSGNVNKSEPASQPASQSESQPVPDTSTTERSRIPDVHDMESTLLDLQPLLKSIFSMQQTADVTSQSTASSDAERVLKAMVDEAQIRFPDASGVQKIADYFHNPKGHILSNCLKGASRDYWNYLCRIVKDKSYKIPLESGHFNAGTIQQFAIHVVLLGFAHYAKFGVLRNSALNQKVDEWIKWFGGNKYTISEFPSVERMISMMIGGENVSYGQISSSDAKSILSVLEPRVRDAIAESGLPQNVVQQIIIGLSGAKDIFNTQRNNVAIYSEASEMVFTVGRYRMKPAEAANYLFNRIQSQSYFLQNGRFPEGISDNPRDYLSRHQSAELDDFIASEKEEKDTRAIVPEDVKLHGAWATEDVIRLAHAVLSNLRNVTYHIKNW